MRVLIAALLAAAASANVSASTVYYVDVVNNAANSIVAFGVAPAGSDRFESVLPGNAPIAGNGKATTLAIRAGDAGCVRDLRVVYADGRTETHRGFDMCRRGSDDLARARS